MTKRTILLFLFAFSSVVTAAPLPSCDEVFSYSTISTASVNVDYAPTNDVQIANGQTLTLQGGITYRYDQFWLRQNAKINIQGSGQVIIYANDIRLGNNTEVNLGGDPSRLLIAAEGSITARNGAEISAFLWSSSGELRLYNNVELTGGLGSGGSYTVDSGVTLDQIDDELLSFSGFCDAVPSTPPLSCDLNGTTEEVFLRDSSSPFEQTDISDGTLGWQDFSIYNWQQSPGSGWPPTAGADLSITEPPGSSNKLVISSSHGAEYGMAQLTDPVFAQPDVQNSTEYAIEIDFEADISGSNNNDVGVVFGYQDDDNYLLARWVKFDSNYGPGCSANLCAYPGDYRTLEIVQMTGGIPNQLALVDTATNLGDTFTLKVVVQEQGTAFCTKSSGDASFQYRTGVADLNPALQGVGIFSYDNDAQGSRSGVYIPAARVDCVDCIIEPELPDALAHYRFEGNANSEGSGRSGNRISGSYIDDGRYCMGLGDAAAGTSPVFESGVDFTNGLGGSGTIGFWFRSNGDWAGQGDRVLFDTSVLEGRSWWFFGESSANTFALEVKNGQLAFISNRHSYQSWFGNWNLTSQDEFFRAEVPVPTNNQSEWFYLAAIWDENTNQASLYLYEQNNNLVSSSTGNSIAAGFDSQQYDGSLVFGRSANDYPDFPELPSNNLANGDFDEIRIFNRALTTSEIEAVVQDSQGCDDEALFYRIEHDGAAVTCRGEPVTVRVCEDRDCNQIASGSFDVTMTPATGWDPGQQLTVSGSASADLWHATAGASVTVGLIPDTSGEVSCWINGSEVRLNQCNILYSDSELRLTAGAPLGCRSESLMLEAVQASATDPLQCAPGIDGARDVNFTLSANTPSDPGSATFALGGSQLPFGAAATRSLTFSGGTATIDYHYDNVGRLDLNASYQEDRAGELITLAGRNSFVVAPAGFHISSPDPGAACASGDHTCDAFVAAGQDFNLSLKAACWQPNDDGNFGNNPTVSNFEHSGINLSAELVAPLGGSGPGTAGVSVAVLGSDNGVGVHPTQVAEVGVFRWLLNGAVNYLGRSVSDFSRDNIGRFTPAYLDVSANTPELNSCGGMRYLDEPFGFSTAPEFTVRGRNRQGGETRNYNSAFWRLNSALARSYSDPGYPLSVLETNAGSVSQLQQNDFSNPRQLRIDNARIQYQRDAVARAPFMAATSVSLDQAQFTDNDGICLRDSAAAPCRGETIQNIGGTQLRYGRMALSNVSASENYSSSVTPSQPVALPLRAQYFDGSAFISNSWDTGCTQYQSGTLSLSSLSDGSSRDSLKQGVAVTDVIQGRGQLGAFTAGVPEVLTADYDLSLYPWLRWYWDGATLSDPKAKITFGRYRGHDKVIYRREAEISSP